MSTQADRTRCRIKRCAAGWLLAVALNCLFTLAYDKAAAEETSATHSPRCPPEQIRSSLERILAQPEYNNPLTQWMMKAEELLKVLLEKLEGLLEMLHRLHAEAPVLYYLIVAASVVLLLLILAHIGYTLYRSVHSDPRKGGPDVSTDLECQMPAEMFSQAEDLASQGAYVDAIRLLFQALLLQLHDQGGSVSFRAQTNREYVLAFRADSDRFQRLQVIVGLLDEKWYGMKPCGREDYKLCRTMYEQLITRVQS